MTADEQLRIEIAQYCKNVKIPGAFNEYMRQEADPAFLEVSFSRRLHLMLKAEDTSRQDKRQAKLLKESGIKDAMPDISRITFESERGLKKRLVEELAQCHWIDREHGLNVIITGMASTGKTWLAKALGKQAISKGVPTVYYRAATLIDRIRNARLANEAIQFLTAKGF